MNGANAGARGRGGAAHARVRIWLGRFAVFLLLTLAVSFRAAAQPVVAGWSDPVPVAETSIAAPPALVAAGNLFHLFWLDRRQSQVVLFHAALTSSGEQSQPVLQLASGVDSRFGWPVAAVVRDRVIVAWMARSGEDVVLSVAILNESGTAVVPPAAIGPPGEESGSIAVLPADGFVHLAWSQFDHGQRRVWYLRMTSDGVVETPPRALAAGDAPALVSGAPLRLFWWQPTSYDTHALMWGDLQHGALDRIRPITGNILLAQALPVVPVAGPGAVDLVIPAMERSFGTAERLYHLRLTGGAPSSRVPLLGGRSVEDVGADRTGTHALLTWSQPAGRRQNSEIFAAVFDRASMRLLPTRVTYTTAGSIRPAIALGGSAAAVAWLEVKGVTQFEVSFATTAHPRRSLFLLGVPELDVYRPVRFLTFSAIVLLSVLPYAALYAVSFAVPAAGLAALGSAVFGSFHWWEALRARRRLRLVLFLLTVLLVQLAGRVLLPGGPGARTLVVALIATGLAGLLLVRRPYFRQEIGFWLTAGVVLVVQLLIVLFPWGVHQLTQY